MMDWDDSHCSQNRASVLGRAVPKLAVVAYSAQTPQFHLDKREPLIQHSTLSQALGTAAMMVGGERERHGSPRTYL